MDGDGEYGSGLMVKYSRSPPKWKHPNDEGMTLDDNFHLPY